MKPSHILPKLPVFDSKESNDLNRYQLTLNSSDGALTVVSYILHFKDGLAVPLNIQLERVSEHT